jgi:hypothetical protein
MSSLSSYHQSYYSSQISTATINQRLNADVNIKVTSRRIKNQEASPHDILFRTHHYEVCSHSILCQKHLTNQQQQLSSI